MNAMINSHLNVKSNRYSRGRDQDGHHWVLAECDIFIRPGWFWHASEFPKFALTLVDIYYKSAGRNCLLLLNVPPNSSSLISPEDIKVIQELSEINQTTNVVLSASSIRGVKDSCFNADILSFEEDFKELVSFNVLRILETIKMEQQIVEINLEIFDVDDVWKKVANGTIVGYR
ncbi:hypothetical protein G4B88_024295 [Cannabis sativa]|uniref:Alpha-L-fucosidase n=1 Tax=Cannabis sativa TaxID=3483 RepID=A0A7J6GG69_CANSA|nr:hypothetical protein G4B88_024295 [Cannabis sativa]